MAPPRKDATFADGLRDLISQVAHLGTLPDANYQDVIALQTLMTDMIAQAEAQQAAKQSQEKSAQLQQAQQGHMGSASPGMPGYGTSPGPTGAHGMMGARPAQSEMPNIGRMMAGAATEGQ